MKKCTLIIFFILLTLTSFGQDGFLRDFQEKWDNSTNYTIEVAQAMPADSFDYKPTEDQMTFKEQLLHMMGNINWLSSKYLGGKTIDYDLKSTEYSKEELMKMLKEVYGNASEAIKNVGAEALEEKVDFFAGPKTRRQIINLLNDHSTHHRGQIIVYLRLNGIKPPRYRGW